MPMYEVSYGSIPNWYGQGRLEDGVKKLQGKLTNKMGQKRSTDKN